MSAALLLLPLPLPTADPPDIFAESEKWRCQNMFCDPSCWSLFEQDVAMWSSKMCTATEEKVLPCVAELFGKRVPPYIMQKCFLWATHRHSSKLRNDTRNTARRLDSDTGSGSPRTRTSTIRYWPSRIQPLKWPIFEQNPSTFGWDMTQNGNKVETRCFGSYLSQILMDFASIWIILKVESCWTALILYRIGNRPRYTIQSLYRYLYRRAVIFGSVATLRISELWGQCPGSGFLSLNLVHNNMIATRKSQISNV